MGWKLAQVVGGTSPESLLDTYHAERHPVAARVLRYTMALGALQRRDDRMLALVAQVSELAIMDEPRKRLVGLHSGLDIHYDLGEGHALLGRRMPDLDLVTADGPVRIFGLLRDPRPVLLNLGEPGDLDITPWADRVQLFDAKCGGRWELPVLGEVPGPGAALIRPDGYVAWVGDGTDLGLSNSLRTWFGPPTATQPPTNEVVAADVLAARGAPRGVESRLLAWQTFAGLRASGLTQSGGLRRERCLSGGARQGHVRRHRTD